MIDQRGPRDRSAHPQLRISTTPCRYINSTHKVERVIFLSQTSQQLRIRRVVAARRATRRAKAVHAVGLSGVRLTLLLFGASERRSGRTLVRKVLLRGPWCGCHASKTARQVGRIIPGFPSSLRYGRRILWQLLRLLCLLRRPSHLCMT